MINEFVFSIAYCFQGRFMLLLCGPKAGMKENKASPPRPTPKGKIGECFPAIQNDAH